MAKKKPGKKKAVAQKAVSFETSLDSLREILAELEEGNLPLSESLEKYEAGIAHLRNCHDSLKDAKTRIEMLVRIDADGKAVTRPYDHSATVEEVTADDAKELQDELNDELSDEDGDWDGGLF